MNTKTSQSGRSQGFSLIELIAVMAIMALMLGLSAPALSSFKNTVGRKGAINQLLSSFEQARVAALTQSTKVYVGFADESFPESLRCKAYIIFRERSDTDVSTKNYVPLTKWLLLPKGISFKKDPGDQYSLMSENSKIRMSVEDGVFPMVSGSKNISVLTFNSSGFIDTDRDFLRLFIYEGFQGPNGQPNFTREDKAYFDMIGFRRYSGKAELFSTPRS